MKLLVFVLFLPTLVHAESKDLMQTIDSYVSEQVKKECEACTFDVRFEPEFIPSENTDWSIIKDVTAPHWKGQTLLSIRLEKEMVSLPVRIRWFDNVVIAKDNIRHGQIINDSDLKVINKDITYNKTAYVSDVEKIVGKIGKRAFRRGQVIDENTVKMPRVVRHGQPIKLFFENGILSMTVSGKAKGSGAVGDIIPIVISRTKKKVMAKIIDSTSARME